MYYRQESEYFRAKLKAARQICKGWVKPADLPSNAEIRDEIQSLARIYEGERRVDDLRAMRLEALRMMERLERFRPRLIGSVLTGHVRKGSDIDIHVFADAISPLTRIFDELGVVYDVERKRVRKDGEERVFTHIHVEDRYPFELTVYATDQKHTVFKSSITGKPIERATIPQLRQFLAEQYPEIDLDAELIALDDRLDRFQVYESLLLPLENVKQSPKYHPEGDALYHSLQVFDLARDELPYDEEFLTAALLHDVGKAIDPYDHVNAGLEALSEFVTERTAWLIRYHMDAHLVLDGTIGARARKRLSANESYEELLTLCHCDRAGRVPGAVAPELNEAIDYLRELSRSFQ